MSGTRRTSNKRNPVETRQRILRIAVKEFAAKGLSGARVELIARKARVNPRMIYHYFGGKEPLYIATLENVLEALRRDELKLDLEGMAPFEAMLQLFEFIQGHFASHPDLIALMSSENINKARYLKRSKSIRARSSSVLQLIGRLLERGEVAGAFRRGIDPLRLYVAMVGLSYFHISNAHTLSTIFDADLLDGGWQAPYRRQAWSMLESYLRPD